MPKILPLVAVAAVGVLAVKAMANAQLLPDLFAPPAAAEGAPPHAAAPAPAVKPAVSAMPSPAAPPPPAPVCQRSPAELAKEAGLSPAELATLQNLGARRGQLDAREQALDTQLQLINAASAKLDGKLKAMADLKAQIQGLMQAADQQSQTEIDRLVVVYEKMKPRDAGALMAALDDKVRVPVASKIAETKPAIMAAIMSQMGTAEGKKLTELLAHRYTPQQTLQQALNGQAPAAPEKPAATAQASAAPPGTTPGGDAAPKAARAPGPARTARRAARPAHAVGHAAPAVRTAAATTPEAAPDAIPAKPAAPPAAKPVQTAAGAVAAPPVAKPPTPAPVAPAKPA